MSYLAFSWMSGFVGELMIFIGMPTSDVYSLSFKILIVLLSAVGVILTPIYLLSLMRRMFYGKDDQNAVNASDRSDWFDAKPREVFIATCLIAPMVVIGFYPKLATQTYDVKTSQVIAQLQDTVAVVAQQRSESLGQVASQPFQAPMFSALKTSSTLGMVD